MWSLQFICKYQMNKQNPNTVGELRALFIASKTLMAEFY